MAGWVRVRGWQRMGLKILLPLVILSSASAQSIGLRGAVTDPFDITTWEKIFSWRHRIINYEIGDLNAMHRMTRSVSIQYSGMLSD